MSLTSIGGLKFQEITVFDFCFRVTDVPWITKWGSKQLASLFLIYSFARHFFR